MRKMHKKKTLYGAKRHMHRLHRKAKKRIWRFWRRKRTEISFALISFGLLLIVACEESVKTDAGNTIQYVAVAVAGFLIASLGAKLVGEVEI